jgi:hypothetical protein
MILASAPQILDNPCCDFINQLPWGFFLAVHVLLFAVGTFLAVRTFGAGERTIGWGFALFAIAEVIYASYHVNITQFLTAHTVAEVLDGLAFVLIFVGLAKRGVVSTSSPSATTDRAPAAR